MSDNARDWHKSLFEALWENQTTPKRENGMTPFELVYGVEAQLSLPLELATIVL